MPGGLDQSAHASSDPEQFFAGRPDDGSKSYSPSMKRRPGRRRVIGKSELPDPSRTVTRSGLASARKNRG